MSNYAYYNGEYSRYESMRIPLTDRALYFGDGVYEVMLARNGRIYQSEEHFARLAVNCAYLHISTYIDSRELLSIIHRLLDLSQLDAAVVYLQISRRSERRKHEIDDLSPNLLITVSAYSGYEPREVTAITVNDDRFGMCNVKTLNLLPSVLALETARRRNADCAIFVRNGFVTEESRANVSMIRGSVLYTHPTGRRILPGITRANLISACSDIGVRVVERPFTPEEMISADEILVSSTTKFIHRVSSIDGIGLKMANTSVYNSLFKSLVRDYLNKTD